LVWNPKTVIFTKFENINAPQGRIAQHSCEICRIVAVSWLVDVPNLVNYNHEKHAKDYAYKLKAGD